MGDYDQLVASIHNQPMEVGHVLAASYKMVSVLEKLVNGNNTAIFDARQILAELHGEIVPERKCFDLNDSSITNFANTIAKLKQVVGETL